MTKIKSGNYVNKTFSGKVCEWIDKITSEKTQRKFKGITSEDIELLEAILNKREKSERENEGVMMKRIRQKLRIHWNWLSKRNSDEVADMIDAWIRQALGNHRCITIDVKGRGEK